MPFKKKTVEVPVETKEEVTAELGETEIPKEEEVKKLSLEDFRQSIIEVGYVVSEGLKDRNRILTEPEVRQIEAICKLYDAAVIKAD